MKDKDYTILSEYLEKLTNQTQMIKKVNKDPNAPVDATAGLEADLRRFRDAYRDKVMDIVVRELVERETIKRRNADDGR